MVLFQGKYITLKDQNTMFEKYQPSLMRLTKQHPFVPVYQV